MNRTLFKKILILPLSLGMPAVFSNISYSADTLSVGYREVGVNNDVSSRATAHSGSRCATWKAGKSFVSRNWPMTHFKYNAGCATLIHLFPFPYAMPLS